LILTAQEIYYLFSIKTFSSTFRTLRLFSFERSCFFDLMIVDDWLVSRNCYHEEIKILSSGRFSCIIIVYFFYEKTRVSGKWKDILLFFSLWVCLVPYWSPVELWDFFLFFHSNKIHQLLFPILFFSFVSFITLLECSIPAGLTM